MRTTLAACGAIVAVAAAGCSAGITSGSGGSRGSSPSPAYTPPAWAKSLGSGVSVTDSHAAVAGDGSPAGLYLTLFKDIKAGNAVAVCSVEEPSTQAACTSGAKSVTASQVKSLLPDFKNLTPTYTAVHGDQALIGFTGSVCPPGSTSGCSTNADPAAIFDNGKSFATLWKEATAAGNSNSTAYSLDQAVRIKGKWYIYASDSSGPDASASPPPAPKWEPRLKPDGTVSVDAPIGSFPAPAGSKVDGGITCSKSIFFGLKHVKDSAAVSFYNAKLPQAGYKITDSMRSGDLAYIDFTGHGYNGMIGIGTGTVDVQMSTPGTPKSYQCPLG